MIKKIRISDLPLAKSLKGLFTVGVDSSNSDVKVDLGFVEEAAETANASAATANQAAQAADTARENIAGDLAQKSSMFTGAIMGKGVFYSTDEPLLFKGDKTVRVVFKTASDVSTSQTLIRDSASNYSVSSTISANKLVVRSNGSEYTTYNILPNNLYELILVRNGGGCLFSLNGDIKTPDCPNEGADATMFRIGAETNNSYQLQATVISAQVFNFAFTDEDAAASWNGGHPELWRAPDAWRNTAPVTWPTGIYQPARSTWYKASANVNQTDNVPAANGFSGEFQRFISSTSAAYTAAFCQFSGAIAGNNKVLFIEFEYRSDGTVYLYDNLSGYGGFKTLPANTGDAQKAYVLTRAGVTCSIRTGPQKTLEIRTLSIRAAGAIVDLIPASLTPTIWKDISGQGNDIPYVPFDSNPAECEMAYENMGFPDTIIGTEAPAVIPNFIGQRYVDTTNKAAYTAFGTSSASDWK